MDRVLWYVLRRLMVLFIGIMVILTAEFVILRVAPYDPSSLVPSTHAQEFDEVFNKSLLSQYFDFIGDMFSGDFGYSGVLNSPISDRVYDAMWTTLTLFLGSLSACLLLGALGGYLVFRMRTHVSRQGLSIVSLALFSVPVLLSAYVTVRYLYYEWGLVPSPMESTTTAAITAIATISLPFLGAFILIVRDGLTLASAASCPDRPRIRDALFVAMPKVQFMVAGLMLFIVPVEIMLMRPGIGFYFAVSFINMDYFLLQATFFLMTIIVFFTNYALETIVTMVRPRRKLDMYLHEDIAEAGTEALPSPKAATVGGVRDALVGMSRDYLRSPVGVVSLAVLFGLVLLAVVGPTLTSDEVTIPAEPSYTDLFLDGATALVAVSLIVGLLASVIGSALGLVAGLTRPYGVVVVAVMQGIMAIQTMCFLILPLLSYRLGSDYGYADAALLISLPVSALVAALTCHGVVSSRNRATPAASGPARHVPAVLSWTLAGLKYGVPTSVIVVFTCDFLGITPFHSWGYAFDVAVTYGMYEGFSIWNWLLPALATSLLVGSMFLVLDTFERVVRTRFAAHL